MLWGRVLPRVALTLQHWPLVCFGTVRITPNHLVWKFEDRQACCDISLYNAYSLPFEWKCALSFHRLSPNCYSSLCYFIFYLYLVDYGPTFIGMTAFVLKINEKGVSPCRLFLRGAICPKDNPKFVRPTNFLPSLCTSWVWPWCFLEDFVFRLQFPYSSYSQLWAKLLELCTYELWAIVNYPR